MSIKLTTRQSLTLKNYMNLFWIKKLHETYEIKYALLQIVNLLTAKHHIPIPIKRHELSKLLKLRQTFFCLDSIIQSLQKPFQ